MNKYKENSIYCPVCEQELAVTHQDRYEDLSEHVSNPNGRPSMKDGYQCVNKKCFVSESHYAWILDGDLFVLKDRYKSNKISEIKLKKFSKSGDTWALNSFNHYYHKGKKTVEEKKKTITLGKFKIDIEPKEYGWDYSQEKRYMPKPFSWKFSYWIKTGDHTYQSWIPHHRMILHCIRNFNTSYRAYISNGTKYNLSECSRLMSGLNYFDTKDERFYSKASSLIIRIIYPGKCSIIKGMVKNTK